MYEWHYVIEIIEMADNTSLKEIITKLNPSKSKTNGLLTKIDLERGVMSYFDSNMFVDNDMIFHYFVKQKENNEEINKDMTIDLKKNNCAKFSFGNVVKNGSDLYIYIAMIEKEAFLCKNKKIINTANISNYKKENVLDYTLSKDIPDITYYRDMSDFTITSKDYKKCKINTFILTKRCHTIKSMIDSSINKGDKKQDNHFDVDLSSEIIEICIDILHKKELLDDVIGNEKIVDVFKFFNMVECTDMINLIVFNHKHIPARYKEYLVRSFDSLLFIVE